MIKFKNILASASKLFIVNKPLSKYIKIDFRMNIVMIPTKMVGFEKFERNFIFEIANSAEIVGMEGFE